MALEGWLLRIQIYSIDLVRIDLRLNSQHKIAWSVFNLINILCFFTEAAGLFYVFNQRSTL